MLLRGSLYLCVLTLPLFIGQVQASQSISDKIMDAEQQADTEQTGDGDINESSINKPVNNQGNENEEDQHSAVQVVGDKINDVQVVADKPALVSQQMTKSITTSAPIVMTLSSSIRDELHQLEVEPLFVKQLGDSEFGYNNSNPTWTIDGKYLGFERHDDKNREIIIVDSSGEIAQTVKYESDDSDDLGLDLLLPGLEYKVSYNAGITWSPDNSQFIYMSNGEDSNYDLYMGFIGVSNFERLTHDSEKDGHANWSPSGREVAFISGRNGTANIYLYDVETKNIQQLSDDDQSYLYPQWSPHGDKLSVIYGSNENHDIYIYDGLGDASDKPRRHALVEWDYDDLRPIWSPDGTKIAFYTNYNEENDPKKWSIAIVDADSKTLKAPEDIISKIVVNNVIPDINKGPAWMPDSQHLVYVKNDRKEYNPIEIVDVVTKINTRIKTNTKINHDVSCSVDGVIAFRSQVEQWDQIFLTKVSGFDSQPAMK